MAPLGWVFVMAGSGFAQAQGESDGGLWELERSGGDPWALDDPGSGPQGARLPFRFVDRPLVLPKRTFRVFLDIEGAVPTSTQGVVRIDFGARMGITEFMEVELRLLRADLSPIRGYGLEQPLVTTRFGTRLGPWQVGAHVGLEVPVAAEFNGHGGVSSRINLGPFRWDLNFDATSNRRTTPTGEADGQAFTAAYLQVGPVFGGPRFELRSPLFDLDVGLARIGGELGCTFGPKDRPVWELSAGLWSPEFDLWGSVPPPPRFGRTWSGGLKVGLFFQDKSRDPFSGDPFFD